MYKKLTVWALAATITLVVSACDDAVDPAGWYLGTEILSKGGGVFDLSVIVLRDHKVAPDGTAVFFECSKPVLEARYVGLEVRTVGGKASVDVTPPPGAPVVVTFTLLGEEGRAGEAVLPPTVTCSRRRRSFLPVLDQSEPVVSDRNRRMLASVPTAPRATAPIHE
jgi:hypothetical protein